MTSHRARLALAAALACALLLAALPAPRPAGAAACVVTSPADGGPGTLRAAVGNTDGFAACDTITFADAIATVTLTSAELAVARDLTIAGRGVGGVRVERGAAPATPAFRLLRVSGGAHLTLRGLTLANGDTGGAAGGGAVAVDASQLTVEASVLTGNRAESGGGIAASQLGAAVTVTGSTISGNTAVTGGGIYVTDGGDSTVLTVTGSTISGNTAQSTGGGIAMFRASLTVTNSTISGNSTSLSGPFDAYNGKGGGITLGVGATATVTGSTLSGNTAVCGGGGIAVSVNGAGTSAAVTVTGSTLSGNTSTACGGGAIAARAGGNLASVGVTVTGSTISGNTGVASGGGINAIAGNGGSAAVTVTGSTISGNTRGGIATLSNPGDGGTSVTVTGSTISGNTGSGGINAIGSDGSSVTVTDSTISGNTGIEFGGIGFDAGPGAAALTVTNSTLSGNTATGKAFGLAGGAIYVAGLGVDANPTVALVNTTLADNTAPIGQGQMVALVGGSALGVSIGGTVSATVANSVFAQGDTTLGGTFFVATGATLTSGGHNVSQRDLPAFAVPGFDSGDRANTDPLLGPLADNGGPTRTRALLPGSPAIDRVPATGANCPAADQRGEPRPQATACDSGAYEARAYTLTTGTAGAGTGTVAPASGPVLAGRTVSLSATPTGGSTFAGWAVDGTPAGDANPLAVTMDAPHTVVATFTAPSPSPAPAPTVVLTLRTAGSGGGTAAPPGATSHATGSVVTLTASPAAGSTFAGWTLDGVLVSWQPAVTLTLDTDHAVVATFAPTPAFGDVPATSAYADAVAQLAARGIINGCDREAVPPLFCPAAPTLRHQMAALIARAMPGWADEAGLPTFTDNTADTELMTRVATLQRHGVVRGYQDAVCQERGLTPPCYGPTDTVKYGQVLLFIARAMVEKGYWAAQPDDRTIFPDQNGAAGADPASDQQTLDHRMVVTYVHYVGAPPDVADLHAPFLRGGVAAGGWGDDSSRGWFARAFWPALQAYFGQDNLP